MNGQPDYPMTKREVQRIIEEQWSARMRRLDAEQLAALWKELLQEPIGIVGDGEFEVPPPRALRTKSHPHLSIEQREQIWERFCEMQAAGNGFETFYDGIELNDTRGIGLVHWFDDIDEVICTVGEWEPFDLEFDPDTGEAEASTRSPRATCPEREESASFDEPTTGEFTEDYDFLAELERFDE